MKNEITIVDNSAMELITKAEIDIQISTAKAFPRDLKTSLKNSLDMATLSPEIAESCGYALPRQGKTIAGPSVRLAEIIASNFGNIRCGARVVANNGKTITAQGICHDLQTNNCVTVEVQRRITTKTGATFNDDMQVVTGNAACAIAFRNAVFKVIPAALIDSIYQEVMKFSKGDHTDLKDRRSKAVKWFNAKGIKNTQICECLLISHVDEIDLDLLAILTGYKNAIVQDGADIKEIFKVVDPKEDLKSKQQAGTHTKTDMP